MEKVLLPRGLVLCNQDEADMRILIKVNGTDIQVIAILKYFGLEKLCVAFGQRANLR